MSNFVSEEESASTWMQERGEAMEQAMAYVCCPAEESRVKVQRYCRKIYELGYVPICPRFGFLPFLDEGEAEDQQAYKPDVPFDLKAVSDGGGLWKRSHRNDEHRY